MALEAEPELLKDEDDEDEDAIPLTLVPPAVALCLLFRLLLPLDEEPNSALKAAALLMALGLPAAAGRPGLRGPLALPGAPRPTPLVPS